MKSCPTHRVRLRFDESYRESVPTAGPLGAERSYVVTRWACPVAGCPTTEEERS